MFLKDIAHDVNLISEIKDKWGTPFNHQDRTEEVQEAMLKIPLRERYKKDKETCPDIRIPLPETAMSDYYNKKDVHYLNVGTHGFYLMGSKDPLELTKNNNIPKIEDFVKMTARIRCQPKTLSKSAKQELETGKIGSQGYQFTFSLEFAVQKGSSDFNLAKISGKGQNAVTIQESTDLSFLRK